MPTTQVTPTEDVLLQGIADALFKARKVVVITGAGISTNSGIPDFRSENGLYSLIQAQFDAASRENVTGGRRLSSSSASSCSDTTPAERPIKRQKISSEDSAICIPKEDLQTTSAQETVGSDDERECSAGEGAVNLMPSPPSTRSKAKKALEFTKHTVSRQSTPVRSHGSLRRSRRAQSLPPSPPTDAAPPRNFPSAADLRAQSPIRPSLRPRGRSASPDPRRRPNAYQTNSAELRKRSLLTSSLNSMQAADIEPPSFASSPLRPRQTWPNDESEETLPPAASSFRAELIAAQLTTPRTTRFRSDFSSPLSSPPLGFSSSPLSSPPTILSDPFQEASSSTSRQSSSTASSTASSEIDETPPSSNPAKALPNIKGRDLFDASIWADPLRTSVFYTFATTLRQKVKDVQPTASHHFIGHLRNRGKLVRCYTQNIDQIEEKVGLTTSLHDGPGHRGRFSRKSTIQVPTPPTPPSHDETPKDAGVSGESNNDPPQSQTSEDGEGIEQLLARALPEQQPPRQEKKSSGVECVFLHGSLESLRCFLCGKICDWDDDGRAHETLSGRQPECPYCVGATAARQERGKRALGVGKLRPDIVLYGEEHPNAHLISPIVTHDLGLCPDLLLILGTSLKVHGLKVLVREFAKTIHNRGGKVVFVNFTKPPESSWGDIIDYWVQWDCDAWVSNLKDRIPLMWLPPGTKLPKKKKEVNDKAKKRQNNADGKTDGKTKTDTAGPCDKVPVLTAEAVVKAEMPEIPKRTIETRDPAEMHQPRDQEPELQTTETQETQGPAESRVPANSSVKIESTQDEQPQQKPKTSQDTPPKPSPQRPMAVRDDKTSAAYLTWKIRMELRRIGGTETPPSTCSAPSRVTKPRTKRSRKSAPAALPEPAQPNINPDDAQGSLETLADVQNQMATSGLTRSDLVVEDVVMSGVEVNSMVAAVKLNPRKRKRKTIDGVEVCFTGTPRSASAKALPRPTPKVKVSRSKDKPLVVSPKILSDIQRVSTEDSVKLPPLRMSRMPEATPSKPPALEPVHSPPGPLTDISPNSQSRVVHRRRTLSDPFYLSDVLINQLVRAPGWTVPQCIQIEAQSQKEAEAALVLEGLKNSSGPAFIVRDH
ncbi:hst3 protein [Colletotrichum kahawae]|uniref:Hst3 protein n=1 Tax=Colletotrichum kahawae TaxID=34407 RepID=A0AAE0CZ01_COLKA|nr:hst3 protein [Colletotrichum kahawae]